MKWLVAVAAALVIPVAPGPAQANRDARPCVSRHEFNHVGLSHGRRIELERRWEVRHLGVPIDRADLPVQPLTPFRRGERIVQYRACGYAFGEVGVWVIYRPSGRWVELLKYIPSDATLHGVARQIAQ